MEQMGSVRVVRKLAERSHHPPTPRTATCHLVMRSRKAGDMCAGGIVLEAVIVRSWSASHRWVDKWQDGNAGGYSGGKPGPILQMSEVGIGTAAGKKNGQRRACSEIQRRNRDWNCRGACLTPVDGDANDESGGDVRVDVISCATRIFVNWW